MPGVGTMKSGLVHDYASSWSGVFVVVTLFQPDRPIAVIAEQIASATSHGPDGTKHEVKGVLLYDNSPCNVTQGANIPPGIIYEHHPENGGTRAAFLRALDAARHLKCRWLLLLDQDSEIPTDYLSTVLEIARGENPAAIVPIAMDGDRLLSPCVVGNIRGIRARIPTASWPRCPRGSAIASGALVSVPHCILLPEPPRVFWLDFLDHWLFRAISLAGGNIVFASVTIGHRLSVVERQSMCAWRLVNIHAAEAAFYRDESAVAKMAIPCRRVGRALFHFIRGSPHWLLLLKLALGLSCAVKPTPAPRSNAAMPIRKTSG